MVVTGKNSLFLAILMFSGSLLAMHRAERLVGHLAPGMAKPAFQVKATPCLGPTRAYVKNIQLAEKVSKQWGTLMARYWQSVIAPFIQLEESKAKDYCGLYHAEPWKFRLYQDFLSLLYTYEFKKPVRPDYIFLRWWRHASPYKDVNEFHDANPMEHGYGKHNDSKPEIAKQILSGNFALLNNAEKMSESSFNYFCNNNSCWFKDDYIKELLKEVFTAYGFDQSYIPRFEKCVERLKTQEGALFYILIPNHLVDSYVYCVGPDKLYGMPRSEPYQYIDGKPVAPNDYDATKKRYVRVSGIFKERLAHPDKFKRVQYDGMQARVLLNESFLNPDNGVIIARKTMSTPDKVKVYKAELQTLFEEMISKKEAAQA